MGYFRDDQPLSMSWSWMTNSSKSSTKCGASSDFVASADTRMYTQLFIAGSKAEGRQVEIKPADRRPPTQLSVTTNEEHADADSYLAQAGGGPFGLDINSSIRWVEKRASMQSPTTWPPWRTLQHAGVSAAAYARREG